MILTNIKDIEEALHRLGYLQGKFVEFKQVRDEQDELWLRESEYQIEILKKMWKEQEEAKT